jgi:hypothetical protein
MTGLAATMGADSPAAATAIADALAARGPDTAGWRAGGAHLVARAAMPTVHEIADGALLLDGAAAPTALAAAYAEGGARALVSGSAPYTVVLADLTHATLVLARNGDGPPLYWARHGGAVLAASEPAALLAAGLPAAPDPEVVRRFLATGACDDGPATFFAGVRRVLPNQVVAIGRGPGAAGAAQVHGPPQVPEVTATAALAAADLTGRIGVRLGCGVGSAAVFGAALARAERPRPLPVYSTTFPELATADSSAYCAAALLGPYALGAARHRALPFFADEIDVDAYLLDLGEPTPELDDWLRWATARRVAGEVDALVDAAAGAHLSRLADRVTSRYGVALRLPLRDVDGPGRRAELVEAAQRTLPSSAAGFATTAAERSTDALLADLLRRMRAELVTTFLRPRLDPRIGRGGLAEVLTLLAGGRVDAPALWRRYLVERWLRCVLRAHQPGRAAPATGRARPAGQGRPAGGAPAPVIHDGDRWARVPVRTEPLAEGDKLPEKLAWYVSEAGPPTGEAWYVLVAAKPVAVMQGRTRSLWDIRPGPAARLLHRLAGARWWLADPWTVQVAVDEGGWWRLAGAAGCALVGRRAWAARLAGPAVRAVRAPREDAPAPGHVGVVPAPVEPGRVAADVVAALRTALPDAAYATLGGCAVVAGTDLLGWAARPGAAPPPPGLLAALCAGDPFGDDHTPIVVAAPAGAPEPTSARSAGVDGSAAAAESAGVIEPAGAPTGDDRAAG